MQHTVQNLCTVYNVIFIYQTKLFQITDMHLESRKTGHSTLAHNFATY